MLVLGIETSCDETAVALYHAEQGLVGHITYTQAAHSDFGGVVPELASREHLKKLMPLVKELLHQTSIDKKEIDGIAFTQGPGLAGALLVGAMTARTLAYALQCPAVGVHHLEGHLLAPFLEPKKPSYPFIALLVSGGHTELVSVFDQGKYVPLGETLDDAAGEAFDKTAKLLGLPYPGGAMLAKLAERGDQKRFIFPKPMTDRPGLDFSFSGLKTFALRTLEKFGDDAQTKADIAAAFEKAVVDTLMIKCVRAVKQTGLKQLVVAGGVSANRALRNGLSLLAEKHQINVFFPRHEFCTDNAAMIAYAGSLRLKRGEQLSLGFDVRPRWPLNELVAKTMRL